MSIQRWLCVFGLTAAIAIPMQATSAYSFALLSEGGISVSTPVSIFGDVGAVSSLSGITAPEVTGTLHPLNDATVQSAETDFNTQFSTFSAMASTGVIHTDASGNVNTQTITPGVYVFKDPSNNTVFTPNFNHVLTLNGAGTYVILAGGLNENSGAGVVLTNGASAGNVFWVVQNSVNFNASLTFNGSILAVSSIGIQGGGTFNGSLLSKNFIGINSAAATITSGAIEAIPEPGSIGLALLGMAGIGLRLRARR